MMRQIIEVADKAVSTDDLVPCETFQKSILDVARLETVLAALVESKAVAIRSENERANSDHSSPIRLLASRIHRRFRSNSTVSSDKVTRHKLSIDNVQSVEEGLPPKVEPGTGATSRQRSVDTGEGEDCPQDECERRELVSSSSRSKRPRKRDEERRRHRGGERSGERCRDRSGDRSGEPPARCWHEHEPCLLPASPERHGHSQLLDTCSVVSLGEECVVVLERERTRTKTRRKKRRRRPRTIIVEAIEERVKVLDPDELPRNARWTIMVTACLLLFLCLLLVGVTLRMAPLIDDMVRQENERMMHESLNVGLANSTQPTMELRKSADER